MPETEHTDDELNRSLLGIGEPAERIQPEQDYADKIAEAFLPDKSAQTSPLVKKERGLLASLIRSTLREEATEAWVVVEAIDGVVESLHLDECEASDSAAARRCEWPAETFTVRRVLVLCEQGD